MDCIGTEPDAPRLAPLDRSVRTVTSSTSQPLEREITEIVSRYALGDVWSRPGLSYEIRSFITLGILTALYRSDQLHTHVNCALNLGITPDEIHEAMLHAAVYGGFSAWNNGTNVARDVFVKRGILEP
jgi:4-carboxymuconolactone decarboxylase